MYVLRNDLGLQGPKFGCGLGQCGACTVIINGVATRSCVTPTSGVRGEITTLEGLAAGGRLHPLQQAWIDEQVPQCGFCQNGQIMTAKALLDRTPHPTDAQIREGHGADAVPLHDLLPHPGRHQARGKGDRMKSRRDFLKTSGMLVVSVGAARAAMFAGPLGAAAQAAGPYPDPDFRQLDSWIVVHGDNTATFYVGKTDCGQGTGTAFRQMMSDELDIAYENTTCVMGSTDNTVDQGGSGGSDAIQTDGWPMRRVAAEARRVLLDMASARFGVPVDALAVSAGVITVKADSAAPPRRVTYGELIGGKKFHVALTGSNIDATTGIAAVKPVQELKIVGQSPQRYDIPAKVDGSMKWAVGVNLPGMVHARNVKPPVAGAKFVSVDESSVRQIPGFIKVVSKGNYVAVVCEREEQAVTAARQLKVNWEKPSAAPFPSSEDLHSYMRGATPTSSSKPTIVGDPDAAFSAAAKIVEAEYDIPFQGHTAFGPAHATADPSNGQMTIYSNDMKSYGMRNGVATFLAMPRDRVRVIWMEGPQGYGRTAADDAGFEAAYLAREIGRPVRVQWMRHEETAWDTKAPAFACTLRGALDAQGNLVGYDYVARAADYNHLGYNEPDTVLIAQLTGSRRARPASGSAALPSEMYADSQSPHGDARRRPAAHLGDAAAHRQHARPERPAIDLRVGVVHRRARGGGESRPGGVPPETAHGRHRGRQRLQAGAIDRGGEGRRRGVRVGHARLSQDAGLRRHL